MGIGQEVSVFLTACLDGVVVSSVYGVIRVFRRLLRHNLLWVSVEDLAYWIWFAFYIFMELHRTCSGRIRWYFVLGVVIGAVFSGKIIFKFIKNKIDNSKQTR